MTPVANANETAKEYRVENKKMVRTQGTSTWKTQKEQEKPVREAFMEGRGTEEKAVSQKATEKTALKEQ